MTTPRQATATFARAILLVLGVSAVLPIVGSLASMTLTPEWRWDHVPFHAAVEVAGGLFALALAAILLAARTPGANQHHLWMAAALVCMGILDIAHAAVTPGETFVWFHSTATFMGGVLFALVWLPARIADSPRCRRVLTLTSGVALSVCVYSLAFPRIVPTMVEQGAFTTTAQGLNILGGLGFLAAAGWFLKRYRTTQARDDCLFACLCGLFGAAGVHFELSAMWDAAWWWWHLLRLTAYGLAMAYSVLAYQHMTKQLRCEIAERRRAEDAAAAHAVELEQRTVELEESRHTAMNMMEDAQQAKRAAERTKNLLARSDQEFMDSCQASADATLLIDGETFVDCNERTVEMLRASSKKQVLATHPSELSPETQPDGRSSFEKANEMIATAFERGSNRFEWDHRRLNGEVFPVEVTLMPISLFGKQMLYCVWKDISERVEARTAAKQAQDELRKLSAAVEQSPATVVITDTNGTIEYVNPRFIETTGYTAEEAIGRNPRILKSNDKSSADYREMWEALLAGQTWRGEFRNKKKSGELYWEAASISPLRNAEGAITHFLAVKEDITDRKRAEEELRENNAMMVDVLEREKHATAKLEAAMEQLEEAKETAEAATHSKSEFLANMSHEIRTPMTAILGYTDVLIDESWGRSSQGTLQVIKNNGEHLLRLINDILDISKIEAGKLEVECIRCSPVQLVADVKSLMQVRADAKNLPFKIEYTGTMPETIESDPTRLRQILVNLIGNAIKFTEVGEVRLVTRLVEDSRIRGFEDSSDAGAPTSNPGTSGPCLQFDIVDTGIGMTEEQASWIFQAFSQADTSTTRKFGGTGLGLMISKRLSEMLGGTITVESQPGAGSTFRVTVATGSLDGVKMLDDPATTAVAKSEIIATPKLKDAKLDCRILLAEDGPDNQLLISHVLKKAGADVTVVENGKLAADAALAARDEDVPFDVILMDMQMPVMDGYEATRLLRKKDYTKPIIALTAHAMDSDRQKCIDAGCDDYASKPLDRKKLIATIQQWVGTSATVEASA